MRGRERERERERRANIELAKWSKLQPPARVIFRKSPSAVDYYPLPAALRCPLLVP